MVRVNLQKKCHYHDLAYGPRPIAENVFLFSYLMDFIDLQFSYIEAILRFRLNVKMHDTVTRLLHRLIKFFDKIIWVDDNTSAFFCNSVPVKFNYDS